MPLMFVAFAHCFMLCFRVLCVFGRLCVRSCFGVCVDVNVVLDWCDI